MVKNIIVQKLTKEQQNTLKKASTLTGETSASKTIFRSLERLIKLEKEHNKLVDKHTEINNKYNELVTTLEVHIDTGETLKNLSKNVDKKIF